MKRSDYIKSLFKSIEMDLTDFQLATSDRVLLEVGEDLRDAFYEIQDGLIETLIEKKEDKEIIDFMEVL